MSEFRFLSQAEFECLSDVARKEYETNVRKQWILMEAEDTEIRRQLNPSMNEDDNPYTIATGQ